MLEQMKPRTPRSRRRACSLRRCSSHARTGFPEATTSRILASGAGGDPQQVHPRDELRRRPGPARPCSPRWCIPSPAGLPRAMRPAASTRRGPGPRDSSPAGPGFPRRWCPACPRGKSLTGRKASRTAEYRDGLTAGRAQPGPGIVAQRVQRRVGRPGDGQVMPVTRWVLRSWWQTSTPSEVAETDTSIAFSPAAADPL